MGCKKHEEIPDGKSDIAFSRVWMHGWSHPINRYRKHEEDAKFCRATLRKEDTCKSCMSTTINGRWKLQFCLSVCLSVCMYVRMYVCRFVCLSGFLSVCPIFIFSCQWLFRSPLRAHVSMHAQCTTIHISPVAVLVFPIVVSLDIAEINYSIFPYHKNLPVEDLYSPPINIRVKDNRAFGRKPLVGIHSVKSLGPFKCKLPSQKTAQDETEVDGKLLHLLVRTWANWVAFVKQHRCCCYYYCCCCCCCCQVKGAQLWYFELHWPRTKLSLNWRKLENNSFLR